MTFKISNAHSSDAAFVVTRGTSREELAEVTSLIKESQKHIISNKEKLFLNRILDQVDYCLKSKEPINLRIPLNSDELIYAEKLNARVEKNRLNEIRSMVEEIEADKNIPEAEKNLLGGLAERLYEIVSQNRGGKKEVQKDMFIAIDNCLREVQQIEVTSGFKGWINRILVKLDYEPYFKHDGELISEKFNSMKSQLQSIKNEDTPAPAPDEENSLSPKI